MGGSFSCIIASADLYATAGLIVACIAVLPVVLAAFFYVMPRTRGRRAIHFGRRRPVDIVLTLSASPPGDGRGDFVRPLTGIGQVLGLAEAVRFLAQRYSRKEV